LPGQWHLSPDRAVAEAERAVALGIRSFLVFGQPLAKDERGSGAWDPEGAAQRAVRAIKDRLPDTVVMADVCLCAYTTSGHCGYVPPGSTTVDNDATLPLLAAARHVTAIEVDATLAAELPSTIAARAPQLAGRLSVVTADAARVGQLPGEPPTVLVANLPYNASVPVVLHLLTTVPSLARGVVMVQAEVADRMCAPPGSRTYGVPSAKIAWFATARRSGSVGRAVFWPVPRVDSGLVSFTRRTAADAAAVRGHARREDTFAVIDAAFAQRRKTLRAALAAWAGSPAAAEAVLRAAGVDPALRGEALGIADFARIAAAAERSPDPDTIGRS